MGKRMRSNIFTRHPALHVAHTVFIALAVVNFLVFAAVAYRVGGDALSGKVEAGQYFLGAKGGYTEVSKEVFEYSKMHELSVVVTLPLAILTGLLFGLPRKSGDA